MEPEDINYIKLIFGNIKIDKMATAGQYQFRYAKDSLYFDLIEIIMMTHFCYALNFMFKQFGLRYYISITIFTLK